MRPRKRNVYRERVLDMCGTVAGVDHDHLGVQVDSWPEERDTNTRAGFEIINVWLEDEGCVLDEMTPEELASLNASVACQLSAEAEDCGGVA